MSLTYTVNSSVEPWSHGEYTTVHEALQVAREKFLGMMKRFIKSRSGELAHVSVNGWDNGVLTLCAPVSRMICAYAEHEFGCRLNCRPDLVWCGRQNALDESARQTWRNILDDRDEMIDVDVLMSMTQELKKEAGKAKNEAIEEFPLYYTE